MTPRTTGARWRAAVTAALLVVMGAALGVVADRLWRAPSTLEAAPLTAEAMAARLGLTSAEERHVRALLDSLHGEMLVTVDQRPDSLRMAVHAAQLRIEAAMPPEARPKFRAWVREHHERVGRLHGGTRAHGPTHGGPPNRAHADGRYERP